VGSASSGGPKSEFAVFHGVRNRFWVLIKDTPLLLLPIVLPLHFAAVAYIHTRSQNRPLLKTALKAYRAAFAGFGGIWKSRTGVRRRSSTLAIARAMTWNPADLTVRRAVIRPLPPTR
jgi:hypothetical protein